MSGARALRWPRLLNAQLAAAVLVALLLAIGLLLARSGLLFAGGGTPPVGSSATPAARMTNGELPRAAIGAVSGALGAADPSYRLRTGPSGARAVNRGQGFAAGFTAAGVSVSSKSLGVTLRTTAAGFGGATAALAPVTPLASSNRVTYARPGLQEWYVNGPLGLEQGFTVERPPGAAARAAGYTVRIALSGSADPVLAGDGSAVLLRSPAGGTLRYDGLRAVDAAHRLLPSWLSLRGRMLSLHVGTRGARFPISIDPLLTDEGLIIELGTKPGEAGERPAFGSAVALSGDGTTALVGGPDGESKTGAAWIFHREGAVWSQQGPKISPPVSGEKDGCEVKGGEKPLSCQFGSSVALSGNGNTALIGAPSTGARPGAAWVLNRSGSTWSQEPELLTGPSEAGHESFGSSVALSKDGNHALIGAPTQNGGRGEAYVFERVEQGTEWTGGTALPASGEGPGAHIGSSVALSSDGVQAIAGAPLDDLHKGSAYVFEHVGSSWVQNGSPLTGAGESGEGQFGESVAMAADGSTVLVGAPSEDGGAGSVWSFVYVNSRWKEFGSRLVGPGNEKEEFGAGLALSDDGDQALVGAPGATAPKPGVGAGAAWLYEAAKEAWKELSPALEASLVETGHGQFGKSVSMSENAETILIGAPHESNRAGAVWLFGERPTVEEVDQSTEKGRPKGHLDGGNKVLIIGHNLTSALAVWFGPYKAGPERILERQGPAEEGGKEKLLVQVPPADEAAEVDVTVETADWLSAINTNDGYTYTEGPDEEGGGGGGGGGTGPKNKKGRESGVPIGELTNPLPTTTSTTTNQVKAGGGVAGSTSSSPACTVQLRSTKISVASQSHVELTFAAHGSGRCGGHLTLQVSVKKGGHAELETIASGSYSATAGHNFTATLKLGKTGEGMLRSSHGHLKARLLVGRSTPTALKASATNVTLSYAKKKT
jgi:FG-GAP repeat